MVARNVAWRNVRKAQDRLSAAGDAEAETWAMDFGPHAPAHDRAHDPPSISGRNSQDRSLVRGVSRTPDPLTPHRPRRRRPRSPPASDYY